MSNMIVLFAQQADQVHVSQSVAERFLLCNLGDSKLLKADFLGSSGTWQDNAEA